MSTPKKPAQKPKKKLPKAKNKAGTSAFGKEQRYRIGAEAYLSNGGNASVAAVAAGYSAKTAGRAGGRMVNDVLFQTILTELRTKTYDNLRISRERILQERARLAFFDPRKLKDKNGQWLPLEQLDDDTAAAVMGVDFSRGVPKYKMVSKDTSLTALEKQLGLYRTADEPPPPPDPNAPKDMIEMARAIAFALAKGAKLLAAQKK